MNLRDPALNYVIVDGFQSPGRARIEGAGIPYKWDKVQGYGLSGVALKGLGRDLSDFTIYIDIWQRSHELIWEIWKNIVEPPKPMSLPLAHGITHPILADVGIVAFAVNDRGAMMPTGGGIWTSAIKCTDWRALAPALKAIRGSIPSAGKAGLAAKTAGDRALADAKAAFEAAKAGNP